MTLIILATCTENTIHPSEFLAMILIILAIAQPNTEFLANTPTYSTQASQRSDRPGSPDPVFFGFGLDSAFLANQQNNNNVTMSYVGAPWNAGTLCPAAPNNTQTHNINTKTHHIQTRATNAENRQKRGRRKFARVPSSKTTLGEEQIWPAKVHTAWTPRILCGHPRPMQSWPNYECRNGQI